MSIAITKSIGTMPEAKTVAFMVYPQLTLLDLVGPLQVPKLLENFGHFEVVTVGESLTPMPTDTGLSVAAERTFDQVVEPAVLIVPGGLAGTIHAMVDERVTTYVRTAAVSAEIVMSVCTGSLILAASGLLNGRSASTHWVFRQELGRLGANVVDARWCEDGKILAAVGISAGIDAALVLVARLAGIDVARTIQTLIEYEPQPPLVPSIGRACTRPTCAALWWDRSFSASRTSSTVPRIASLACSRNAQPNTGWHGSRLGGHSRP
ncbi:DJ-1/PfpI family protein [Mycobacterium hodleri]|uniref:DJ-1/PfpI family protein n=1 Tax=Mycolicibacterium hodleri TaxID=49897 RepID=A0A544VWG5_9MYCO|nr:DJ-1/PfpI family protein [Mycolicibacterium hodleri]TQR84311.1 DJ-1/PfpI family protein [Mycolicibacterium hodleri]